MKTRSVILLVFAGLLIAASVAVRFSDDEHKDGISACFTVGAIFLVALVAGRGFEILMTGWRKLEEAKEARRGFEVIMKEESGGQECPPAIDKNVCPTKQDRLPATDKNVCPTDPTSPRA